MTFTKRKSRVQRKSTRDKRTAMEKKDGIKLYAITYLCILIIIKISSWRTRR